MSSVENDASIDALLRGDPNTVRALYDVLLPNVIAFVKSHGGLENDAHEVFQEALVQIMARARSKGILLSSTLHSYIYTACRNLWYKEVNRRTPLVRNDGFYELETDEDDLAEKTLIHQQQHLLQEKIPDLSDNCKQLLKDYFAKMAYSDIVKKYHYASENTAFQRVFKCKKRLMEIVKKDARYRDMTGY
ncbi:MAG: sigma-70 family RNA polymerase sigma factor [Bacteroidota bacterium]